MESENPFFTLISHSIDNINFGMGIELKYKIELKCKIMFVKRTLLMLIVSLAQVQLFAQTQSGCTITFPNNFDDQVDISNIYDPALCPSGDLILSNLNDRNGLSTVTFDADITLNSLTLNYKAGNNPLEIIIPSGVTVTVTTDLTMNLTSTVQDKFLTVDGVLDVGETLDFGGINLEIDGTGSISATDIIGADATSCTNGVNGGTGTCPTITAGTCDDSGGGFCVDPALPVELLLPLTGAQGNGFVSLEWSTATEENNDFFTIEKSIDGVEYFELATVDGAGNSLKVVEYQFTDYNPTYGLAYYRLRQTDFDGAYEVFSPISVSYSSSGLDFEVSFNSPIGKGEQLRVITNLGKEEDLRIDLYDLKGHHIIGVTFTSSSFEYQMPGHLKPGMYIIQLSSLKASKTSRLLVQ